MRRIIQRLLAILLVTVSLLGLMGTNNFTTYAKTVNDGMIYCPGENYIETKKTADPNGVKANGLVHGKTLYVIGQTTGTDGKLWYEVQYYTGNSGTTLNTAFCPAERIRLNKDAAATATGKANGDISLWSCTKKYQAPLLETIPSGTKLYITDEKEDSGLWYRVYCTINGTTVYGWIEASGITRDAIPDIATDGNYEQGLIAQGFPVSYAKSLAILHEQYPNWVFVPVNTGLDWNTVITEESKAGRNLIHKNSDDAKKSTASSEYNYYKNTWTIQDNSGWVTAHPDYIAYCMDPRNFLNVENIFMFESLSYSNAHNLQGVQAILKNSFMKNTVTDSDGSTLNYAEAFMNIGQSIGVSPYHLASRVLQEQGTKGSSPLISGVYAGYEGLYNYFNYGAYGTPESVLYASGLTYAKNQGWTSRYASLLGGSKLLARNYINVGQDTLYFQKFNVVNKNNLYKHQYMTNVEAAISEGKKVAGAYSDKTQAFVFKIPIYTNMPDAPVQFTASGNRNNYLSALRVEGFSLTPSFNGAVTEYSVIVDAAVTSVKISADSVVKTSTINGTGTHNLNVGNNTITVTCTSQSGEVKTYTIMVVRMGMGSGDYTLTSDKYLVGDCITGVEPGTETSDFIQEFTCNGDMVKVLNADGVEKSGKVATGDRLGVYKDGVLIGLKEIVIYGDINGDGAVTIADLVRLNRHTLNVSTLSGTALTAADVNRNGSVNIQDLVMVNRHILGIASISQK